MTYNTESSTGVDDRDRDGHPDREAGHDSEHDPRDPVYSRDTSDAPDETRPADADADDVRDEAYHADDPAPATSTTDADRDNETDNETDTETDTELDAAARPDATDTVDDETDRDERYEGTRGDETDVDREAEFNAAARGDEADYDVTPEGGPDATRMDESDAMRAEETDTDTAYETDSDRERDYETGRSRVDGEEIAVPNGPIEANPPTAVAVAPVNAAVPTQTGRDEADAREAGQDRDAVEAVNADAGSGTVYQAEQDEQDEQDEYRADNGPIVSEAAEDEAAQEEAVQEEPAQEDMKPGTVEPAPVAAFWNDADAQGIRDRWRELQLRFIDDPQSVTGEAELLVEEAVASLSAALAKARQDLGGWRDGQGSDTERLRAAVRSYRDFLDRILGL